MMSCGVAVMLTVARIVKGWQKMGFLRELHRAKADVEAVERVGDVEAVVADLDRASVDDIRAGAWNVVAVISGHDQCVAVQRLQV
jgi:hypothetical protein